MFVQGTIEYYDISQEQAVNRANLAAGVKGIQCTHAGALSEWNTATPEQVAAVQTIRTRLNPDEEFGSIEVYANGAINIFGKLAGQVFGFWTYRP